MSEVANQIQGGSNQPDAAPAKCVHCNEPCPPQPIMLDDQTFCCEGCKTVYEILNDNGLCKYYELDENAGISLKGKSQVAFAYLDEPEVRDKLIDFSDGEKTRVTFYLPQIHCSSCIWLLENLYKLNEHIYSSKVNFLKKEINIVYSETDTTIRQVVELLDSIAYTPAINLSDLDESERPLIERKFFYKLGVAGFAFGNIMLLSFPEYLGLDKTVDPFFFQLFGYLNIFLAIPVVFYSGRDYLTSALLGLRQRNLNIDVPISLGMLTLFLRSVFEIVAQSGAGYLDSLAGLVFFLLIGKWFQQRTYHTMSFDRDYKSYFPIAANLLEGGKERSVSLEKLQAGDCILVRNRELIPADGVLLRGAAEIDYSFVTGESAPVTVASGEKVYAGGRQLGQPIELSLTRKVSQSYLTQLWNEDAFAKDQESHASKLANKVGKYFTFAILFVAFSTLAYWVPRDISIAINAFTAVLIIACPCAVALAIPFIFGNAVRILGKQQFYLKNTNVIEALADFSAVVFDKTGTLTKRKTDQLEYVGQPLSETEKKLALAMVSRSNHPISQQLKDWFLAQYPTLDDKLVQVSAWEEVVGKGIKGIACQRNIKIGSWSFMDNFLKQNLPEKEGVYLQINHEIKGYFKLESNFREGIGDVFEYLEPLAPTYLLSGDNERERDLVARLFPSEDHLRFHQSPKDKLAFIQGLQDNGQTVFMMGDGLNDAGALKQSDVGVVVTENTNNFTPASDAILQADQFGRLPLFLKFAKGSIKLVFLAYSFAFLYNVIGLSFAVQGTLSPIVAAILMPLSSISIVLFGMLTSNFLARKLGLTNTK
jgi:Cu+-exporting ATPase